MSAREHDVLVGIARAVLRIGPALPDDAATVRPMRERRIECNAAHRDLVDAVIRGEARDFWDETLPYDDRYDAEQATPLMAALWAATRLPCASPADRWALVERAIVDAGIRYASARLGRDVTVRGECGQCELCADRGSYDDGPDF